MVALRLVRDIVTGRSKQYAFIEYKTSKMALNAYMCCKTLVLNDTEVFVDFECERILPGWKPRRLGMILIHIISLINLLLISHLLATCSC